MKKRETISRHLVEHLGFGRALMVQTFVMLWSLYRATHGGEDPRSMDDFAAEVGKSRSQVYRWQADFRRAFPEWERPGELLDHYGIRTPVTVRVVGMLGFAGA